MKKLSLYLALALTLSTTALAQDITQIPTSITVQNLNGSQQYIQVYTVDPLVDPQALIDDTFSYEGYQYTYTSMTKEDIILEDECIQGEVVVVESSSKDLSAVLALLAPTIDYAVDGYVGVLALDHTSIDTQAAGYTTKSYTVSETKTYSNLPSNDMSYVQATTIKDGRTLPLVAVEWQVQATALVGSTLMPSQYTAIATYSDKASYSAATGYLTTATYEGTVSKSAVDSVTYTIVYTGTEISAPMVDSSFLATIRPAWFIGGGLAVLLLVGGTVWLVRKRRQDSMLIEEGEDEEEPV